MTRTEHTVVTLDTISNVGSTFSTLRASRRWISPEFSNLYKRALRQMSLAHSVLLYCSESDMFKISIIEMPRERRLIVEGNLINPWVAEFRRSWTEAGVSLEGRTLVVDLTSATMIDLDGEAAICELMQNGVKFCCSGVLTRHVLQQAAAKCHTRLRNILDGTHSRQRNAEEEH